MGWDFDARPRPKAAFVQECLAIFKPGAIQAQAMVGDNLWLVIKDPGKPAAIVLALLEKQQGCWGVKWIDEAMGPVEDNCPVRFLAMAPPPGGPVCFWRDRVKANGQRLPAGAIVNNPGQLALL